MTLAELTLSDREHEHRGNSLRKQFGSAPRALMVRALRRARRKDTGSRPLSGCLRLQMWQSR